MISLGSDQQAIDTISFDEEHLIIHLTSDTDAEAIKLYTPDGELLTTKQIERKQQLSTPLFIRLNNHNQLINRKPFSPGEYTLVATKSTDDSDSETISERTVELTSSFTVSDVAVVNGKRLLDIRADQPYAMNLKMKIKNTGNLPLGIKYIGVTDGVPTPTPPPNKYLSGAAVAGGFKSSKHGPDFILRNSTDTFTTSTRPLYWMYRMDPDRPSPHAWGIPEKDASEDTIKKNHCTGETHPATITAAPMNIDAQCSFTFVLASLSSLTAYVEE